VKVIGLNDQPKGRQTHSKYLPSNVKLKKRLISGCNLTWWYASAKSSDKPLYIFFGKKRNKERFSYLIDYHGKYWLILRKSTIRRQPPPFLGIMNAGETWSGARSNYLMAPLRRYKGSSVSYQTDFYSDVKVGDLK
jgi:hypothetical protein